MSIVLKNWKPREVVAFLTKNGFEIVKKAGDHYCLFCNATSAYTEVDMGRRSGFTSREMKTFVGQAKIPKELWRKGTKIKL